MAIKWNIPAHMLQAPPTAARSKTDAERIAALRQALEQIRAHAYAMTTAQIEATAATALRVDEGENR